MEIKNTLRMFPKLKKYLKKIFFFFSVEKKKRT